MKTVIIDTPGRFSRRSGEQVADATYAASIEKPRPYAWLDRLCWIVSMLALAWFAWACLALPRAH